MMKMPRIEPTVSYGNILTVLGLALGLSAGWATMRSDMAAFQASVMVRQEDRDRRLLLLEIARARDDRETADLRERIAVSLASMDAAIRQLTSSVQLTQYPPVRN